MLGRQQALPAPLSPDPAEALHGGALSSLPTAQAAEVEQPPTAEV